ncbi:hypothetical protein [Solwaraspora sp. WMMA2101]|uniref:hypothetical protein n=1 Tax=Solwaraspora sp. WMMA2101 TaxID=3404124 RepID=UPI003B94738F
MSVDRADFGAFFAAVRGGQQPFRWQERLLDHLLTTGRWPDQLVAPTGAGKTSVIDVQVFAVALMAAGHPVRVPRRLALVVDRRALVDDQHHHATATADLLAAARGDSRTVLARVAAALDSLRTGQADPTASPLSVALLRGGAPPSRSWLDEPTGAAVLCATPDMWGSRLLLAGYGSRAQARPREAGLLAYDTVAVVDEAHLSRQLVTTARRVAELAAVVDEPLGVPVLQVVETTATPHADAGVAVGVEADDLAVDAPLRQRLTTPKPVTLVSVPTWPIPKTGPTFKAGVAALADEAARLHRAYGATVGCFVNSVAVAAAVDAELRARDLKVELICGRLRPYDVDRLRPPASTLLTLGGDPTVDVLVSTQSLEVGVDLDLAAAVTELAPGGGRSPNGPAESTGSASVPPRRSACWCRPASCPTQPSPGRTSGTTWRRRAPGWPGGQLTLPASPHGRCATPGRRPRRCGATCCNGWSWRRRGTWRGPATTSPPPRTTSTCGSPTILNSLTTSSASWCGGRCRPTSQTPYG